MDASMLMGDMSAGSLGMDAAMVGAVNEMTNWVKARLDEWTWDDKFHRYYPVVPFLCAFAVCYLVAGMPLDGDGLMDAAKCAATYGVWASFAWNVHRVTLKGQ
jgi:hypothetical protein